MEIAGKIFSHLLILAGISAVFGTLIQSSLYKTKTKGDMKELGMRIFQVFFVLLMFDAIITSAKHANYLFFNDGEIERWETIYLAILALPVGIFFWKKIFGIFSLVGLVMFFFPLLVNNLSLFHPENLTRNILGTVLFSVTSFLLFRKEIKKIREEVKKRQI